MRTLPKPIRSGSAPDRGAPACCLGTASARALPSSGKRARTGALAASQLCSPAAVTRSSMVGRVNTTRVMAGSPLNSDKSPRSASSVSALRGGGAAQARGSRGGNVAPRTARGGKEGNGAAACDKEIAAGAGLELLHQAIADELDGGGHKQEGGRSEQQTGKPQPRVSANGKP